MTNSSLQILNTQDGERLNDPIILDYDALKAAAMILRAINNNARQQLIALLEEHRPLNVTEIYQRLHWEQSVTSVQLAILRQEKIVITERKGQTIYYSLNYDSIASIAKKVADFSHTSH